MGGNVSSADVAHMQCYTDLNYGSDKESAGLLLENVKNLTVVSIQTSERFYIGPGRYDRLTTETEHADWLYRNTRFWYWLRGRAFVVWDLVTLACLIHPEWFESRQARINYVISGTGDPRILPASVPQEHATVNIPEHRADVEIFWEWAFARM